jgi:hypothetical protein
MCWTIPKRLFESQDRILQIYAYLSGRDYTRRTTFRGATEAVLTAGGTPSIALDYHGANTL